MRTLKRVLLLHRCRFEIALTGQRRVEAWTACGTRGWPDMICVKVGQSIQSLASLTRIKVVDVGTSEAAAISLGGTRMSHSTLLLHVGLQDDNEGRMVVARELADRFDSVVIGIAACDPRPPASFEGIYPIDVIQADRSIAKERLQAAEGEFRKGFTGRENRIEWRSAFTPPGAHVARLCRAADLVVTGAATPELLADPNWRLDPGDLVMRAGRPVLVVPEEYTRPMQAKAVVIGWKDNRESRRAVADALPLARLAERVLVVSVAETDDDSGHAGAADVIAWFRRHGVAAEERCEPLVSDPASQLRSTALREEADLIVTGAYGHSRAREWMLGGVTHDLLTRRTAQCLLMSH